MALPMTVLKVAGIFQGCKSGRSGSPKNRCTKFIPIQLSGWLCCMAICFVCVDSQTVYSQSCVDGNVQVEVLSGTQSGIISSYTNFLGSANTDFIMGIDTDGGNWKCDSSMECIINGVKTQLSLQKDPANHRVTLSNGLVVVEKCFDDFVQYTDGPGNGYAIPFVSSPDNFEHWRVVDMSVVFGICQNSVANSNGYNFTMTALPSPQIGVLIKFAAPCSQPEGSAMSRAALLGLCLGIAAASFVFDLATFDGSKVDEDATTGDTLKLLFVPLSGWIIKIIFLCSIATAIGLAAAATVEWNKNNTDANRLLAGPASLILKGCSFLFFLISSKVNVCKKVNSGLGALELVLNLIVSWQYDFVSKFQLYIFIYNSWGAITSLTMFCGCIDTLRSLGMMQNA